MRSENSEYNRKRKLRSLPESARSADEDGGQTIDDLAFLGCVNLSRLEFPDTLKAIEDRAFSECTGLTEVTLPSSLQRIGTMAFESTGLQSIVVPSSVSAIGPVAFHNCQLRKAVIEGQVETVQKGVVEENSALKTVILSEKTRRIRPLAFAGCNALKHLELPEGVHADVSAFIGCQKIANACGIIMAHGTILGFSSGSAANQAALDPIEIATADQATTFSEDWYPTLVYVPDKGISQQNRKVSSSLISLTGPTSNAVDGGSQSEESGGSTNNCAQQMMMDVFRNVSEPIEEAAEPGSVASLRAGQLITMGRFPQDTSYELQPLVWRVLTVRNNKAFLLCEKALFDRTDAFGTQSEWRGSPMQKFLNGTFFDFAFEDHEQSRIVLTHCATHRITTDTMAKDPGTEDRIFLLDIKELQEFLPESSDRIALPTPCAVRYVPETRSRKRLLEEGVRWDLRSRQALSPMVVTVTSKTGVGKKDVERHKEYIRPAMWIK